MKRAAMLLVVALVALMASAVQAADTTMVFYSYVGTEPMVLADDAHFALMKADDFTTVAEGDGSAVEFTVDNGDYVLSVEQPSRKLYGSLNIKITDEQPTPRRFVLVGVVKDGELLTGELKELLDDEESRRAAAAAAPVAPAQPVAPAAPAVPQVPYGYGYGAVGGGWPTLGMLGAVGGIIAVAVTKDNKPQPVTPSRK